MSSDNIPVMNQRFVKIVDRILQDNETNDNGPKTDSDISRLITDQKDRGVMSRIRNGHAEPSRNHIERLAELFNIDYNAFFRNVDVVYYGAATSGESSVSIEFDDLPLEEIDEGQNQLSPEDGWLEHRMLHLEEFFRNAEQHISQIPEEYSEGCNTWLKVIESEIQKTQGRMTKELLDIEKVKRNHAQQLLDLSSKLNESQSKSLRYLEGYMSLKEKERKRELTGEGAN